MDGPSSIPGVQACKRDPQRRSLMLSKIKAMLRLIVFLFLAVAVLSAAQGPVYVVLWFDTEDTSSRLLTTHSFA